MRCKNDQIIILLIMMPIILLLIFNDVFARKKSLATVDIYGTNQLSIADIQKEYQKEIANIAKVLQSQQGLNSNKKTQIFASAMNKMIAGIKSKGDFAYVGISPIIYPNKKTVYITIDVVEKKDSFRLNAFKAKPVQSLPDPHHLIEQWLAYEKIGLSIIFREKRFPTGQICPAHHCLYGFSHPLLKKYENLFKQDVEKYKFQLIEILKKDRDENKRAAAAFLLAHIKNASELISILLPSINDSSALVRNNVMRVIAKMLAAHQLTVPIASISKALYFPNTTDRNKALAIINSAINDKAAAEYVIKHSGALLIKILKLTQPNNHDLAYSILKKLSAKDYGERNYQAWENWLSQYDHHIRQ